MRKNNIETWDGLLSSTAEQPEGFFDLSEVQVENYNPIVDPLNSLRMYYWLKVRLAEEEITHKRVTCASVDFIANFGGLAFLLISIVGMFLRHWVEFQYTLELMHKLYMVKTKSTNIKLTKDCDQNFYLEDELEQDLKNQNDIGKARDIHWVRVSTCKQLELFMYNLFGCLPENALDTEPTNQGLTNRWFIFAKQRLMKQLDVVTILQEINNSKIANKLTKEQKAKNKMHRLNTIRVDEDDQDETEQEYLPPSFNEIIEKTPL